MTVPSQRRVRSWRGAGRLPSEKGEGNSLIASHDGCGDTDVIHPWEETTWRYSLVVSINAMPGKGGELAQVFKARCAECMQEPGCEQFEVFQSALNPDKLALLELWTDQAALDAHAKLNATRPPMPSGLRAGGGVREDYTYMVTRS